MLRRLMFLSLVFAIFFGVLTSISTLIGQGIDSPVTVALARTQFRRSANNANAPESKILLFDLNRAIRIERPIPLSDVRQVSLDYTSYEFVFVTAYSGRTDGQHYTAGLYQYDYVSSTLTPISLVESDRSISLGNTVANRFFPLNAQEGRKIGFIHPLDRKIYRFDTQTAETHLIADLELSLTEMGGGVSWSPDASRVAVKDGNTLHVFNPDGIQQLEYEFDTEEFTAAWSLDGQYLYLMRYSFSETADQPITVISATDGSDHPFTKDLIGELQSWWSCDSKWLTYTKTIGTQTEGYLLNMDTGDTIRLNDDPLLAEANIGGISPTSVEGCGKFFITLNIGQTNQFLTSLSEVNPARPTYLFDLETRRINYIDDATFALIRGEDDNILYYDTVDTETSQHQIFKRTVDPLGEPVMVGEYAQLPAFWPSWSADMTVAVYSELLPDSFTPVGELHMFDLRTGQSRELTSSTDNYIENYILYNWSELRSR
jgi:hypothetical protein